MAFKKIGALWLKEGPKGKFMSGEIEIGGQTHRIMVFKNNYKDAPNKPDYTINTDAPDETAQASNPDTTFE